MGWPTLGVVSGISYWGSWGTLWALECDASLSALEESGSLESGSLECGSLESGSLECGSLECGPLESGSLECGSLESGPLESGSLECGSLECGSLESGPLESGSLECGSLECGSLESGPFECGSLESGPFECGSLESGSLECGSLESGSLESGYHAMTSQSFTHQRLGFAVVILFLIVHPHTIIKLPVLHLYSIGAVAFSKSSCALLSCTHIHTRQVCCVRVVLLLVYECRYVSVGMCMCLKVYVRTFVACVGR